MNFKSLVTQLANRINQPHVIEIYMRKVFASGVEWQKKAIPLDKCKGTVTGGRYRCVLHCRM